MFDSKEVPLNAWVSPRLDCEDGEITAIRGWSEASLCVEETCCVFRAMLLAAWWFILSAAGRCCFKPKLLSFRALITHDNTHTRNYNFSLLAWQPQSSGREPHLWCHQASRVWLDGWWMAAELRELMRGLMRGLMSGRLPETQRQSDGLTDCTTGRN